MRISSLIFPRRRLISLAVSMTISASFCFALSSCADQHGIAREGKLADPAQLAGDQTFGQQHGAWPDDSWVDQLGGPALRQMVDRAIANSPDLSIASARLRQAAAIIDTARAAELPHVDGGLQVARQRFSSHYIYPAPYAGNYYYDAEAAITASYDFDFWGRHKAEVEAALSQARAADAERHAARIMLTSALVSAWANLGLQQAQLDLNQQALDARAHLDDLTHQRQVAGLATQSETDQNRVQSATLENARNRLLAQIALSRNLMAALMGAGPDAGRDIVPPALPAADALPLSDQLTVGLLGHRPDIVAARWRVEAADSSINIARTAFYPDINIKAMVGLSSLELNTFLRGGSVVAGVTPAISLPIFEGGALRADLRNKTGAYDEAVASYNKTLVDALRDVADQIRNIEAIDQQLATQQHGVQAAQNLLALSRQRYEVGTGTMLQVASSQLNLVEQQEQLLALNGQRLLHRVSLTKALGGGFDAQQEGLADSGPAASEKTTADADIRSPAAAALP